MRPKDNGDSENKSLALEDLEDDEKGGRGVRIELKNVWFKYPTRDVPVLQGLNMTVSNTKPWNITALTKIRSRKDNLQLLLVHQVSENPNSIPLSSQH